MPIRVVHLVAKTHLDLGFTALASEVEQQYLEDFFPRTIAVAAQLRERGGAERLVWTTGSWILHRALHQPDVQRARAVDAAVRGGDLAWHALPLTTHTELMDAASFRTGLGIGLELDARFGRTTTAAKMTDVPGHTRAIVPLLAAGGITFLHLGVNPAWPVPDVPEVFRWRSPDGSEVAVAYAAGGYGRELVVPGCDQGLAFLHSGDNLGPPSADDVLIAHAELRARFPDAEVRASTLDAFARALATSGAMEGLPVVTAEIGDPWLFGAGSDPQKLAAYRDLLDRRRRLVERGVIGPADQVIVDRQLLLVPEHTWGLDQKIVLPDEQPWDDDALVELRATAQGRRFEASWAEQRAVVDHAVESLRSVLVAGVAAHGVRRLELLVRTVDDHAREVVVALEADAAVISGRFVHPIHDGQVPDRKLLGDWNLRLDPATGAIVQLEHVPTGRHLADRDHPLGLLVHQTFSADDYDRFFAGLQPTQADHGWAIRDNTKPGIDQAGAISRRSEAELRSALLREHDDTGEVDLLITQDLAGRRVQSRWSWLVHGRELRFQVGWLERPATRLPEATWCSFVPIVAEPQRWEVDKLGQRISPLDVVPRGGRSLHAVGEGMHYEGPDGRLAITTSDAPLVAPGQPNLLDADPPLPDLSGGWHVLLHNNCWGTNFPMWNEGPARFRFALSIT